MPFPPQSLQYLLLILKQSSLSSINSAHYSLITNPTLASDIYAALWPFLGIVVEVLLLGIIIFIFEKRRAKAEFEESDTDQGNDQ